MRISDWSSDVCSSDLSAMQVDEYPIRVFAGDAFARGNDIGLDTGDHLRFDRHGERLAEFSQPGNIGHFIIYEAFLISLGLARPRLPTGGSLHECLISPGTIDEIAPGRIDGQIRIREILDVAPRSEERREE